MSPRRPSVTLTRGLAALVLAAGGLVATAEDDLPKELTPTAEAAAIQSAQTTGQAIYRHDRAAAVATDAVLANDLARQDRRVRGWITEEDAAGQVIVTFVDATPAALYRVTVSKDGVAGPASVLAAPAALTDYESGAVAARAAAMAARFQPCSDRYNSVVLPVVGSTPRVWMAYLLPGTTKPDVVPVGGTYRMDVNDAGVISQRGFTRSCITLPKASDAEGLVITHLLDAVPTEAHVFWSLWARTPMFVVTPPGGSTWVVENGKIRLVERKATKR